VSNGEELVFANGGAGILASLFGLKGEFRTFRALVGSKGLEVGFELLSLLLPKGEEPVLPNGVLGTFTPGGPNELACCLEFAVVEVDEPKGDTPRPFGFCPIGEVSDLFSPLILPKGEEPVLPNGVLGTFTPGGPNGLVCCLEFATVEVDESKGDVPKPLLGFCPIGEVGDFEPLNGDDGNF
jgi:hypothetical protein